MGTRHPKYDCIININTAGVNCSVNNNSLDWAGNLSELIFGSTTNETQVSVDIKKNVVLDRVLIAEL